MFTLGVIRTYAGAIRTKPSENKSPASTELRNFTIFGKIWYFMDTSYLGTNHHDCSGEKLPKSELVVEAI